MRPSQQPTLGQLRLLPDDERVAWLRTAPEGQWLERKGPRIRGRELGDVLVGFANAEGGLVCIGIADGTVEGVDHAGRLLNEWRQAAMDFTVPPVRHTFEVLDATDAQGVGDHLVVIEVPASERVHENGAGATFLRVGDENRRLGPLEAQELRYDKGESTFDGSTVTDATMAELDPKLSARYGRAIRAGHRLDVALRARGMAPSTGDGVTVAGALVLGSEPQRSLPEAFVRLLRYHGTTRETGSRSNIVRDVRVEGPLPHQR